MPELAVFSRSADEQVELRGPCPKWIADVLDAVGIARDESRMGLVIEILGEWAHKKMREATLIHRVTRGNGSPTEGGGGDTDA